MTALLIALLIGLLGSELYACVHALAKWLVRHHASKLPPGFRERMEEEWLAALEEFPSHIWKLKFALELFIDRADLLQAHGEKKISGNLNVTLEGVSATGSVGNLTPSGDSIGNVPFVGNGDASTAALLAYWRHASAQHITGAHIASTAQVFPDSVKEA